ncbi:MAG TPA: hypothetical protein GXZ60_08015 [Intrasporangiaceae bacterium]|nr:hypothetical protein [Intrasporangiaceae bacterium]
MSDDVDMDLDGHGSVAEEIAALAEALRARRARPGAQPRGSAEDGPPPHQPGIDACGICPVCRLITTLHTVSPSAVNALADLAQQAELTLRTLAVELQRQEKESATPAREDIPVDDLADDLSDDPGDETPRPTRD